jgi:hypothetical protein
MSYSDTLTADPLGLPRAPAGVAAMSAQGALSAVSWGAVAAGATAAAALSLILLILGTGLGLSSVSPWSQSGVSATAFGLSTILWLTFTQIIASGMGGYLAGRLRSRWLSTATDEVYFRDTAHGFLSWAVASLVTAAILGSAIASIVSGGLQGGASAVGGVASTAMTAVAGGAMAGSADGSAVGSYLLDSLFRRDRGTAQPAAAVSTGTGPAVTASRSSSESPTAEVARIFATAIRTQAMPVEDLRYVGQIVAERTGLPQPEAEKRVSETFTRSQVALRDAEVTAKSAADKTRKASAYAALWLFVSLLAGAFVASLTATFGGRQRDM